VMARLYLPLTRFLFFFSLSLFFSISLFVGRVTFMASWPPLQKESLSDF